MRYETNSMKFTSLLTLIVFCLNWSEIEYPEKNYVRLKQLQGDMLRM